MYLCIWVLSIGILLLPVIPYCDLHNVCFFIIIFFVYVYFDFEYSKIGFYSLLPLLFMRLLVREVIDFFNLFANDLVPLAR